MTGPFRALAVDHVERELPAVGADHSFALGPAMTIRRPTAAVVLSIAALLGAAVASVVTLAWPGAFPDPVPAPAFNGALAEARGWSLVTLLFALPVLALAMTAAARGSWRGRLAWPGTLAYLFYTYLELAVSPPFTALYLIYVATFACAASALVIVVVALDRDAIVRALGPRAPRRSVAGFALATGGLLALAWLKGIVARTLGGDFGWPVGEAAIGHVVHALDLGLQVPLAIATGVLLLRRAPGGAVAAAVMLVNSILMGAALTAMVAASALAAGTSVASAAPFALLPAVALLLAARFFRGAQWRGQVSIPHDPAGRASRGASARSPGAPPGCGPRRRRARRRVDRWRRRSTTSSPRRGCAPRRAGATPARPRRPNTTAMRPCAGPRSARGGWHDGAHARALGDRRSRAVARRLHSSRTAPRRRPMKIKRKSDAEIQQAVLRELKWDTRVEETDVGVEVDGGIVTLTGTVSSWPKRAAAQEAAHRVAGVLDVANDVQVELPGSCRRSDTVLAGAVRSALAWDVLVNDTRIRSTVSDGWVTLDGDVDCWSEREDAEHSVRNLAGVRGITNHIEIKPPQVIHADVRKAIEDALERQAERDAARVKLAVHDGRVDVSGIVHSWAERTAVLGAARGTHGVRQVDDHLRIEPYSP